MAGRRQVIGSRSIEAARRPRGGRGRLWRADCAAARQTLRVALLLCAAAGCSAHPIIPVTARPLAATKTDSLAVIVLTPVVRIDQMPGASAPLAFSANARAEPGSDAEALAASLHDAAAGAARALNVSLIDCRGTGDADAGVCEQLDPFAAPLAHGSTRSDARSALHHAGETQPNCAVLASQLIVELGPGSYYNSATGQMGSAMSTSAFRAALTRCDPTEVLWKNEILLRAVPDLRSTGYAEAVQALFAGAPKEGQ